MQVVAIHGWKDEPPQLVQALATAVGITPYEMKQRLIGGGPSVVGAFAVRQQAMEVSMKINLAGVATLVVDSEEIRGRENRFIVRRFELLDGSIRIEEHDGRVAEIRYEDVELLLPGTRITEHSETVTVTERKLSLAKTILSGGLPMTTKVERQEEHVSQERENILYLYAAGHTPVLFSQTGMTFDGLGPAMKLTRELNFAHLKSELRRLSPNARQDDRLMNRLGQARLLGPGLSPDNNIHLAFHILSRSLLGKRMTD